MAALPAIANIGSQLDRAVVAWLVSQNIGTAPVCQVLPHNTPAVKINYPVIIISSMKSLNKQNQPGNNRFTTEIQVKQSAVLPPNTPNPENQRVILDQLVGQVLYQMLQSNDGQSLKLTAANITTAGQALATSANETIAENNADMTQFTLQNMFYMGHTRGEPNEEGVAWMEVITFDMECNPYALNL